VESAVKGIVAPPQPEALVINGGSNWIMWQVPGGGEWIMKIYFIHEERLRDISSTNDLNCFPVTTTLFAL
jgi:hypothetical protein